jgi:hypothetical protein
MDNYHCRPFKQRLILTNIKLSESCRPFSNKNFYAAQYNYYIQIKETCFVM